MNKTLCIFKPDLVANSENVAKVLQAFVAIGFTLHRVRVLNPMSRDEAEQLYQEHVGRDYYERNIEFVTSGPSLALVLASPAWDETGFATLRRMIGATDPRKAEPRTLRWEFGTDLPRNALHASASAIEAKREISIFFPGEEIT